MESEELRKVVSDLVGGLAVVRTCYENVDWLVKIETPVGANGRFCFMRVDPESLVAEGPMFGFTAEQVEYIRAVGNSDSC